jgi:hypothetical protein
VLPGFGCKVTRGGKASWFVEKAIRKIFARSQEVRKLSGRMHDGEGKSS